MTSVSTSAPPALIRAKATICHPNVTPSSASTALLYCLTHMDSTNASILGRLAFQARLAPLHPLDSPMRPGLIAATVPLKAITKHLTHEDIVELFREIMRPPFSSNWTDADVAALLGLGYQWDFDNSSYAQRPHANERLSLSSEMQEMLLDSPWPFPSLAALSPLDNDQFGRLINSAPVAQRYPFFNVALAAATTSPQRLAYALTSGYARLTPDPDTSPWGDLISSVVRTSEDALPVVHVLDPPLAFSLLARCYPFDHFTPSPIVFRAALDRVPDYEDLEECVTYLSLILLPNWYLARLALRVPGLAYLGLVAGQPDASAIRACLDPLLTYHGLRRRDVLSFLHPTNTLADAISAARLLRAHP